MQQATGVQSSAIARAEVALMAKEEARFIASGGNVGHITDEARDTLQDQYAPAVDVMTEQLNVDLSRLEQQQPTKRVKSSLAGLRGLASTVAS